ncbi:MAG: DUF4230 domain-containing protein [Verrucomicrobiota bacterium]|nr:DUF4230 domain-containing protein [Verrucomicrobiota bacterium]
MDINEQPRRSEKPKGAIPSFYWRLLSAGIVACAILFVATWSLYTILYKGPLDLARGLKGEFSSGASESVEFAKKLGREIKESLQITPIVTVNGVTVFGEIEPILELATVERKMSVRYGWTHSWLGSEKVLEIEALVLAKAGFNLKEPFTISIDPKTRRVTAKMPPAKVLSVEILDYQMLKDDSGWWNEITDADRQEALNGLRLQARVNVRNSGILKEVMKTSEDRITEIVQRNGGHVDFVMADKKEKP